MGFQMLSDGPAQGSKVKETDIACLGPAWTFKGKKREDIACLGPTELSKEKKKKNRETNLPGSYYNITHRLTDHQTLTPRAAECWKRPWKVLHVNILLLHFTRDRWTGHNARRVPYGQK
jgi:hypothetical protein